MPDAVCCHHGMRSMHGVQHTSVHERCRTTRDFSRAQVMRAWHQRAAVWSIAHRVRTPIPGVGRTLMDWTPIHRARATSSSLITFIEQSDAFSLSNVSALPSRYSLTLYHSALVFTYRTQQFCMFVSCFISSSVSLCRAPFVSMTAWHPSCLHDVMVAKFCGTMWHMPRISSSEGLRRCPGPCVSKI
jgi:hypothetical protein